MYDFGIRIQHASPSPDGKRVAYAGNRFLGLWRTGDADTRDGINGLPLFDIDRVAWAPDGRTVAVAGYKRVALWDALARKQRAELKGHDDWVTALAWSPDGKTLATAARANFDGTVKLWDATTDAVRAELDGHEDTVRGLAWSPDGTALATASRDKTVRVWDAATGHPKTVIACSGEVHAAAWAPDGKTLTIPDHRTVKLVDAATGMEAEVLWLEESTITSALAWSPDGRRLVVTKGEEVVLWDVAKGAQVRPPLERHAAWVVAVWWSPDGKTLSAASRDGHVRVWDEDSLR